MLHGLQHTMHMVQSYSTVLVNGDTVVTAAVQRSWEAFADLHKGVKAMTSCIVLLCNCLLVVALGPRCAHACPHIGTLPKSIYIA